MKTLALVGFTWTDAIAWIAFEARVGLSSMRVEANSPVVTVGPDRYVIIGPRDSISDFDQIVFDEIITRELAA